METQASNRRHLLRLLLLQPLQAQKQRLLAIILALATQALAQGLLLIMVKGFTTALFGQTQSKVVLLAELLPPKALKFMPYLANLSMARADLALLVPALIFGAGMGKALATYVYQLHQQALALLLAKNYRDHLFKALLSLSYAQFRRRQTGEWMSVLMNDVMVLQTRFSDILTGLVRDSVAVLSCLAALAWLHWPTALVLLALAPLIAFGMGRTGKRIARYAEAFQRELARLAAAVLDLRSRFDFIRAQSAESFESNRFAALNLAYFNHIRSSILVRSAFAPLLELFGFGVFAGFIYVIGHGLWGDFTPDLLLQALVALGLLVRPLREMGEQLARFHETRGTLKNSLVLFDMLDTLSTDQPRQLAGAPATTGVMPTLVIENLVAGHDATPRFAAQNLLLQGGQAIAIVGPSGAGKSTLIKTLAGLMAPLAWNGGKPWTEVTALATMVSQEPFLFDDTLAANLTYGLAEPPSSAALAEVLATVNMQAEIDAMPEGIHTRLRAIGTNLSGGQLQRLVIARALLRERPLWLLDEATSAIDARSEKDITLRLIAASHATGSLLLAVTHRLTWLDAFDEVWFVEQGRVVLKGHHQELLSTPRYRNFCDAAEAGR